MHVVAVAVLPEAPIFELAVPCEVFGIDRPDLVDPWYELRLCTVGPGRTRVAAGFEVDSPHGLEALAAADTVIVPAYKDVHALPPPELLASLRVAHGRGARVAAICTGAFVLAAAGLLAGRRATTHWMHAESLSRRYPDIDLDPFVLYAQDGRIFTSAGTAAGLDLCLELVRQDHGSAVANMLARRLVIPPHRGGGQAQFVETPLPRAGSSLAWLLDWALARLDQPLVLSDLARAASCSKRTLARRFQATVGMTPMQWLLAQRIRRAQQLLEATDEPVERVAQLAGFGSPANLRQHFHRATGVSPLAYRRTFRHRGTAA
jgi:AraC family transcriptional regulator, transcriptional activator FtrA